MAVVAAVCSVAGVNASARSSVDGLFSGGRTCEKALTALLIDIRSQTRKVLSCYELYARPPARPPAPMHSSTCFWPFPQMENISHGMSKQQVLEMLSETGRQRHAASRAAGVLVAGQENVVLALLARMNPDTFETPEESKAASVLLKGASGSSVRVFVFNF